MTKLQKLGEKSDRGTFLQDRESHLRGVGLYPNSSRDPRRIYVLEFAYPGCRGGEAVAGLEAGRLRSMLAWGSPGFVSWLQMWTENSLKRHSGSHSWSGD